MVHFVINHNADFVENMELIWIPSWQSRGN